MGDVDMDGIVWEKCDMFDVKICLNDRFFTMPRKGDRWLMQMFVTAGFSKDSLLRLDRVRVHQQVLFLSCILGASGKILDKKYTIRRKSEESWSTPTSPEEKPHNVNFHPWKMALMQIVPIRGIPDRLGRLNDKGYTICDWTWYPEGRRLLHFKGDVMDIYRPSKLPRMENVANRRKRTRIRQEPEVRGQVCTTREVDLAVVAIVSNTDPPREHIMPISIKQVLKEWGCTWMWRSLRIVGDDNWIRDAIKGGTLVAITDGSYIKERYTSLYSAAFVLEGSKGSGRSFGSFAEWSHGANA